jgi:hypothetical protein
MKPNILEVSIEKLVMEDLAIEDGERIRASVERELSRLLIERDMPESYVQKHDMAQVNGGRIDIAQGSDVSSMSEQIARAIYGGMHE